MWQREQAPSTSDPGRSNACDPVPMSNFVTQSWRPANGLCLAFAVPSGGSGVSQLPWVEISRAESRNAARQAGSRHALAIVDPFHSSKTFLWQVWHWPGWLTLCQYSSNGGATKSASDVTYGAGSGIRFGSS